MMGFLESHQPNECDKCLKKVGKKNLFKVRFLYMDKNDKVHKNLGNDYHQYWVCKDCIRYC